MRASFHRKLIPNKMTKWENLHTLHLAFLYDSIYI